MIKISIFASATRWKLYPTFMDSVIDTSVDFEVIFCGPNPEEVTAPIVRKYFPYFRYIQSENIKPAQCYEIARRECIGELIHWTSDDCEYTKDLLSRAYYYWESLNDRKLLISLQTVENGMFCDMNRHWFFKNHHNKTPLMAPLGVMSRDYLECLGGFDCRYMCGQYENDVAMRVLSDDGKIRIFGDKNNHVKIDHVLKHGINRPFLIGLKHDTNIFRNSWSSRNKNPRKIQKDDLQPYPNEGLLNKSYSYTDKKWK